MEDDDSKPLDAWWPEIGPDDTTRYVEDQFCFKLLISHMRYDEMTPVGHFEVICLEWAKNDGQDWYEKVFELSGNFEGARHLHFEYVYYPNLNQLGQLLIWLHKEIKGWVGGYLKD